MTPSHYPTPLEAKVAGRNIANTLANVLSPIFHRALGPLVGQKIVLCEGGLNQKATKILAATLAESCPIDHHIFFSTSGYSLKLYIKVCTTSPGKDNSYQRAHYTEEVLFLGDLDGQVLNELYEPDASRRTDFTAADVTIARNAVAFAEKALAIAQNDIRYFGKHDNN